MRDGAQQRSFLQNVSRTLEAYGTPPAELTTYYGSRHRGEVWFTAVAKESSRVSVLDWIGAHMPVPGEIIETDAILGEDLRWYRVRLQHVCDIALAIEDGPVPTGPRRDLNTALRGLPDPAELSQDTVEPPPYEARLASLLEGLAPSRYRTARDANLTGQTFWRDLVRWPHRDGDKLSPPGHWLWNLLL